MFEKKATVAELEELSKIVGNEPFQRAQEDKKLRDQLREYAESVSLALAERDKKIQEILDRQKTTINQQTSHIHLVSHLTTRITNLENAHRATNNNMAVEFLAVPSRNELNRMREAIAGNLRDLADFVGIDIGTTQNNLAAVNQTLHDLTQSIEDLYQLFDAVIGHLKLDVKPVPESVEVTPAHYNVSKQGR